MSKFSIRFLSKSPLNNNEGEIRDFTPEMKKKARLGGTIPVGPKISKVVKAAKILLGSQNKRLSEQHEDGPSPKLDKKRIAQYKITK
tara:strand:+ start:205 stop:465 length:261 start_codon:yes stop_codon:yes gene_type:complete